MTDIPIHDASLMSSRSAPKADGVLKKTRQSGLLGYALLVPSLVFLGLFTYGPIAQLLADSLFVRKGIGAATEFAGWSNYKAVLGDPSFHRALVNNVIFASLTVFPSLVLSLFLAMALVQSTRVNAALRAVFFFPVLVPLVAAASLFLFVFLPGVGLIDHYLARFFVNPPNWLGDPDIALYSLIGVTIWKNAGYYMLFFLAGLQSVPPDAYEAAYLDGASPWQRLRYVTLPYLKPTIAFVAVISLLNIITQVDHVFVLTKGGPSESTSLVLFYIYQQAVESYDIGKASAATFLALLALLGITLTSLRTLERSFGGAA